MSARARYRGALAGALALVLAPAAGLAQPVAKWNPERIAGYAQQLAKAGMELETAARKALLPGPPPTVSQQRARYEFLEALRLFENSAHHLAEELKAGKGREATAPTFRRLQTLRRDVEDSSQRMEIPDSLLAAMLKAGELMLRLAPYYADV